MVTYGDREESPLAEEQPILSRLNGWCSRCRRTHGADIDTLKAPAVPCVVRRTS